MGTKWIVLGRNVFSWNWYKDFRSIIRSVAAANTIDYSGVTEKLPTPYYFVDLCGRTAKWVMVLGTLHVSWFMGAHRFPHLGCLATVTKPVQTWLLVLHCSTFRLMYCKWQPLGQPFGFHLATGVGTCAATMHVCPTQFSIKGMRATSLGSLLVGHRLGHFMDCLITHRHP